MGDNTPDLRALIEAAKPQQAGGGKIFAFVNETINTGGQCSLAAGAPIKFDGTFKMGSQKRPNPFADLLGKLGFNKEDFCKGFADANKGAPVREASQADLFGHGGPSGGFVQGLDMSPRGGGSFEIT